MGRYGVLKFEQQYNVQIRNQEGPFCSVSNLSWSNWPPWLIGNLVRHVLERWETNAVCSGTECNEPDWELCGAVNLLGVQKAGWRRQALLETKGGFYDSSDCCVLLLVSFFFFLNKCWVTFYGKATSVAHFLTGLFAFHWASTEKSCQQYIVCFPSTRDMPQILYVLLWLPSIRKQSAAISHGRNSDNEALLFSLFAPF